MSRILIICISYIFGGIVLAQEKMPLLWETKLDHTIMYIGTGTEDRGHSFAASDKAITIFSNETGETIWSKTFKELAPELKQVDDLICFWESNTIFLFERKPGNDQIACINIQDGELLWNADKYQDVSEDIVVYIPEEDGFAVSLKNELIFIKARNGEEVWSTPLFTGIIGKYIYNSENRTMVMVNSLPDGLGTLFKNFENQIAKIDVKNGEIIWENTYFGNTKKKIMTKEYIYDLQVNDDKVYLQLDGMQVYDYSTGDSIWFSVYENSSKKLINDPKGTKKIGVYNVVANPVIDGDYIYILDMSDKKSQYITKHNFNTGELIWASDKIEGARAIPAMKVIGDKIGLQIGGKVEAQVFRVDKCGDYLLYEWLRYFRKLNHLEYKFTIQEMVALPGNLKNLKKG
ncbi:MAG: PQQ-binding-like beta-propeller repeat protein [Bacteroidales bacterium]|nr:PQQ-binding-like beta-propeller repeat protein [Bacteroidales bacterium]